jgi:hypothetical protein
MAAGFWRTGSLAKTLSSDVRLGHQRTSARGTMDEVSSYFDLDLPSVRRQGRPKIVPPRPRIPYWKGPGTDSEEKHEPASDIDTVAVVESLKALDPKRPISEAE